MFPTQWCLHAAAFYDRLVQNVLVSPMQRRKSTGCRLGPLGIAVALSFPMFITVNVPMSDIIISLTLVATANCAN